MVRPGAIAAASVVEVLAPIGLAAGLVGVCSRPMLPARFLAALVLPSRRSLRRPTWRGRAAWLLLGLVAAAASCDAPKAEPHAASASAAAKKPAPPAPPAKRTTMPELLIDELGVYFDGRRADVRKDSGKKKLKAIIAKLPIDGKQVTVRVLKKAKVQWVAEALWQLGEAGAPQVLIKTDGRGDMPKELVVVPESRLGGKPDGCSVTAMVTDDLSTAVWPISGGGGTRHRKGFAGPDLSHTGETLEKKLSRCNSTSAFFSASSKVIWEHAYNIGALLRKSDKDKHIQSLVLLYNEPVAGRKVKLGK